MGWDDGQGRASTPPRAASPFSAARRATTPPRGGGGAADGGLVAPPVAPRPTAQNAGFGGDMPIVIGTVVPHSSTTRLSRAGDELSDAAVEFNALQSLRQPRPSDVVIAEPFSEVRICGKYVPRSRAFCCTGCVVVLALCGVFASPVIFGDAESDQGQASPGSSETWSYDDMPLAAEIPASSPHVELELRADLSEMPEGSAARREFEASVITSAAEVMQISKRRIAVLELRQGSGGRRRQLQSGDSVLVTLGIVPAVEGETSASAAVALLAAAVTMRNDQLSGVLSGAQITASGNMLGEVGEVRLSQARPCSRGEIPDRNGNTCSAFVIGRFHDCTTMMAVYQYDCSCTCDRDTMQPLDQVQWSTISYKGYYDNPVVVVSPATSNDMQDAHVRVRQSTSQSFQLALQEPTCLDQQHAAETVSWMVVEAGSWNDDIGIPTFEADTVAIAPGYRKERWQRVALSESLQVPVVVSHLMTSNEGHTSAWSRLANLDTTGFDIALEEASWDGFHSAEICGWVAFEGGGPRGGRSRAGAFFFEAAISNVVGGTSQPTDISFREAFDAPPMVFSSIVSTHACCSDVGLRCDGDTSALRMTSTSTSTVSMRVKEMVCGLPANQPDDIHDMDESVAYIAMATDGASSSGSMIAPAIGCDGERDGKQVDECGDCGGDGSRCRCWSHIPSADVQADYLHLNQKQESVLYRLPDDGLTHPIDIGFTFNFYGVPYTQVRLSANGYLHFGSRHTRYGNTWPIPSVEHPNNIAAVFWTDLDPSSGGEIRGWGDLDRKVFEWSNVPLWSREQTMSTTNSFEVQLKQADNSMLFLYEDVSTMQWDETHAGVTIGVEDSTGEAGVGIEYSFDVSMQLDGFVIPASCHRVIGCDGLVGSDLDNDVCGVCGGDASTCTGCMSGDASNFDPTASIPDSCSWDDCVDNCPAEGCSGAVVWGGVSQFVSADFRAAVDGGTQHAVATFGHAFIDEYGLTMDGSGDYAMVRGTDSCIEAASVSVPADAGNCLAVVLGQPGSQAECEGVMTEADASVPACTYTPGGLPDYSADGSFTIAFWFSKMVCDPGSRYEYLWSHVEQPTVDILWAENSNINLYLSCAGYGAFSVAEGGPGEGSTYLRTNLVDSDGQKANWDSLLHVDGFDAITEQWINIVMSFSPLAIETWVDGVADHDFTHHLVLQSCTQNAAYPDPTTLNTELAGFSLGDAPLYIGGRADLSPDRHFRGTIAGAAVYGYTVQAAEVGCNWQASEAAIPLLPESFYGCTDQYALNFDPAARVASDTCTYPEPCYEYRRMEWIDATGGERHEIGDDAHVRVDLPFAFNWFAESFDYVNIASNGFVTFGDGDLPEDGTHVNGANARTRRAPDPAPPNNAAFAWWTDLDPSTHGGTVFTLSNSTVFVVEWNSPVFGAESSDNNAHFQIVLSSDGALWYNYERTPSTADLAAWSPVSVGVEGGIPEGSGTAQRGMTVSYNQPTAPDSELSVYFASQCIG